MRSFVLVPSLLVALAVSGSAQAGGWATVELASSPQGVSHGDTWRAELTVLRHGVTPTDGAAPAITIRSLETSRTERYPAAPTGTTGVYAADVVFPEPGRWSYEVDNGLAATGYGESAATTYPPVSIGPKAGGGETSFPANVPFEAIFAIVALVAAVALAARRFVRPVPNLR